MSNALEHFYQSMNNIVLRDISNNNQASIFVKHYKQKSCDFDASLPDHIHPAFIVNGTTDPALLIGKYINCDVNGHLYSLPNSVPSPALNSSAELPKIRTSSNISGLTIADHGLLVLMAHQNNWLSHGNNASGCDYRDGTLWAPGSTSGSGSNMTFTVYTYHVNDLRLFRGYRWKCIKEHQASTVENKTFVNKKYPDLNPDLWKKVEKVGGTLIPEEYQYDENGLHTLTGSGPLNWYFLSDPELESDVQGQGDCYLYGIKMRSKGQILLWVGAEANQTVYEYHNDAASPQADFTLTDHWRAIALNNQNETGYELIVPDSTNDSTVPTLHYIRNTDGYMRLSMVTQAEASTAAPAQTFFNQIAVDANVPALAYELGLAPISHTIVDGKVWAHNLGLASGDNDQYFEFVGNRNKTQNSGAGIGGIRIMAASTTTVSGYPHYITRSRARVLE